MQSRNTLIYLLLVRPYMLHLLMPAFHIKINSHSLFVIEDLTCNQELSLSYKNTCDMQLFHPRSHSNNYSKFDLHIWILPQCRELFTRLIHYMKSLPKIIWDRNALARCRDLKRKVSWSPTENIVRDAMTCSSSIFPDRSQQVNLGIEWPVKPISSKVRSSD